MTSTEETGTPSAPAIPVAEQIEQAKEALRAEFAQHLEQLQNELGAQVIEEISKVETAPHDTVTAPTLTEALTSMQQELTETMRGNTAEPWPEETSKPVDTETRALVTRIHSYIDGLADRLGHPRMGGN